MDLPVDEREVIVVRDVRGDDFLLIRNCSWTTPPKLPPIVDSGSLFEFLPVPAEVLLDIRIYTKTRLAQLPIDDSTTGGCDHGAGVS